MRKRAQWSFHTHKKINLQHEQLYSLNGTIASQRIEVGEVLIYKVFSPKHLK